MGVRADDTSVEASREGLIAGMSSLERPKLRPVMPRRVEHQGQPFVLLQDPTGVVSRAGSDSI